MKNYILSIILVTFVVLTIISNILSPTNYYSSYENRYLATFPTLRVAAIFNNDFSLDLEKYINDQFILRNQWIKLKSFVEMTTNKQENNAIYFGKDNFLFEKMIVEDKQLSLNSQTLTRFLDTYKQHNIKVMIPLSSYMIYSDYLPDHAPTFNQQQWLDKHTGHWPMVDISNSFYNQPIPMYYKNDHHWTLDGAYIAYRKFVESNNMIPFDKEVFLIHEVDGFLGSYYAKAKPMDYLPDVFKYIDPKIESYTFNNVIKKSLIDADQLSQRDKYSSFLFNNPGYAKITINTTETPKRILIIKDSYANSVIPFLTAHFDEIEVIDLRNFNGSIQSIIRDSSFDSILFLHSFSQFSSDKNVVKLNY